MSGIFTFECRESNSHYIAGGGDAQKALSACLDRLNQGSFFFAPLQEEWDRYGQEAFDYGVAEEVEPDNQAAFNEAVEEWKSIFESVEYMGWIDQEGRPAND